MKIVVVPADHGAVGHYRAVWPARSAQKSAGHDISIIAPHRIRFGVTHRNTVIVDGVPAGTDVLVMQRLSRAEHLAGIQWLQRQGVAVVVDYDDAMWAISRDNYAWKAWNGGDGGEHWKWADKIAAQADLVTVTTRTLASRYGSHGRYELLPNYLPPGAVADGPHKMGSDPVAGWSGTLKTHPCDLPSAAAGIRHIIESTDMDIAVLGDGDGVREQWNVPPSRFHVLGSVPFSQYHTALDKIDIGLVPLENSTFNSAKSWLKAMEFAGRGIPVVASATPANRELARSVPVLIAETANEWPQQIQAAIDGYEDLAAATREAAKRMVIDAHAHRWSDAWERAGMRRKNLT